MAPTQIVTDVFVQCVIDHNGDSVKCDDHMQDYLECLHHKKEVRQLSPSVT
jgi:hypothetical protein